MIKGEMKMNSTIATIEKMFHDAQFNPAYMHEFDNTLMSYLDEVDLEIKMTLSDALSLLGEQKLNTLFSELNEIRKFYIRN
jgi:hypothetical protein